ncbi:O-antigen ligase family protein [Vibrio parahaemolyticus]|uniref:O-antigen ligase family protein n=1 Tax=Vibrio parahaemolyticus TaxID=670 RepID=UPI00146B635C|nr:O-antigen ligase family protein [Vibrio parahaemolyticus]MDF5022385.1 O-antigen ligase family protein [Vibrio parahaemolyticus]MDF5041539.1 O-antigen ligase family protein [Vibrio parahaemolyticus]MDF5157837.1 O-antigen ligase family protein [Vibrio parahaemolyticus]MDF5161915.1 O-antigen ligase family protein [Vibrio parahaemolyticus]MDF5171332.1 O-antigen ligase family protein [Vibrio parahaemolyticus]
MKNAHGFIATLPFLFTFTATFWYTDATKDIVFITLASIACYQLISYRLYSRLELHWDWISKALVIISAYYVFSKIYHGFSSSALRVVLSITLCSIFLPRFRFSNNMLACFVTLSAISACSYYVLLGSENIWNLNRINFATYTAAVAVLSLFLVAQKQLYLMLIGTVSFILVSFPFIGSSSRGPLLAFTMTIGVLILQTLFEKNRMKAVIIIILSVGVLSPQILNNSFLSYKLVQANEYNGSNVDKDYNIHSRLELWKAGLSFIPSAPLLGHGYNDKTLLKERFENYGGLDLTILYHYHNQIISAWVRDGFIGAMIIIFLLLKPATNYLQHSLPNTDAMLLVCGIYAISGLTDTPLSNASTLSFYLYFFILYFSIEHCNESIRLKP